MKGLVTAFSGKEVTILMDGDKAPFLGRYYFLEDSTHGTGAQRRTREKLIMIYWKSGLHPKYGGSSYDLFRDKMKLSLGEGFEKYIYTYIENGKGKYKEVDDLSKIPTEVLNDPEMNEMILGKLKSCSKYTKKQNQNFIDNLIEDMISNGVNSKELSEMLEGMSK